MPTTSPLLPESAQRVARLLAAQQYACPMVMLPESARTAAQAAAGLGCSISEIAKSIIFRRLSDMAPVLVIASGSNRVDEAKVAVQVGPVGKADARFVREKTGYAIGGVSPIGHRVTPLMLLDQDLFDYASVWVAAGHPQVVFSLRPQQLQAMTGASVADIALSVADHPFPANL